MPFQSGLSYKQTKTTSLPPGGNRVASTAERLITGLVKKPTSSKDLLLQTAPSGKEGTEGTISNQIHSFLSPHSKRTWLDWKKTPNHPLISYFTSPIPKTSPSWKSNSPLDLSCWIPKFLPPFSTPKPPLPLLTQTLRTTIKKPQSSSFISSIKEFPDKKKKNSKRKHHSGENVFLLTRTY